MSNELYEHYSFQADKGQEPLRVDKFLMNFIENATRNKIQKAAEAGNIFVNDVVVKSNHKVKGHDVVKVMLSEPPRENEVIPEDIPLNIVFEDEHVLVVNKPAGLVVHPGHGNYTGTLVNGLKFHFDNLPSMSADLERPGLVHRIDKDTSGLLVVAKTELAMQHLAKQFAAHTTERKYHALVWGTPKEETGTIEGNIGRSLKNRLQMDVFPEGDFGKKAITHYKLIETFRYVSLLECQLETGRTHQIRAHMKHVGHPLFNDERYGGNKILKGTTFTKYKQFIDNCLKICPRQALHAKSLGFEHPKSGEFLRFDSQYPDDLKELITKWQAYVKVID